MVANTNISDCSEFHGITGTSESTESSGNKDISIDMKLLRNKLETSLTNVPKAIENPLSSIINVVQDIRKDEPQKQEHNKFSQNQKNGNIWSNRTEGVFFISSISKSGTSDKISTISDKANGVGAESSSPTDAKENVVEKQHPLPVKVFVTRESYLTSLEVHHMRTIYNIFVVILTITFMNSICYDYLVEGRIHFGLRTFQSGFGKLHYVLCALLVENLMVFTLFYAVKGWAIMRSKLKAKKLLRIFWSWICLITYISSQLLLAYLASALCLRLDLPFVSAIVLLFETTRLLMKMHAFVRTVAARVIAEKSKVEENVLAFGPYLYYIFAPTLIYRDNYPRTSRIRWRFATARFLEVVAIAFLYSYIHERHIQVHFYNYGVEELTKSSLIVKFFGMLMPSIIIFISGFYLLLHSWLNFTGELLRFGDRMFYKDWWTSRNFDAYYRNWNIVVHDWLYEYIYKDVYTHIFKGSKLGASLVVFFVSAAVHECILGFALQLFFPVMFMFFGVFGVLLVFITRYFSNNFGNVLLWFSLIVGAGAISSLYSLEYYARFNCSKEYNSWVDFFLPAVWTCYRN